MCFLIFLPTLAAAQPTTEDGIRALLRGEHQAAARILRPLADNTARPDPVAQFFLAVLYEAGEGVRPDHIRACSLFLRAAMRDHPLSPQAAAIAEVMQQQFGAGASMFCIAEDRWQGGPAQSFDLGPGHRIVFADTSISVTHGDQEQRAVIGTPPGGVSLPIQYSPLVVTRPLDARRHFFQWFQWRPDKPANPSAWSLGWALSEVVGDQWIPITGEQDLVVVNSPARPDSYDVGRLVRLQVNTRGEAEFTMTGGGSPRTEVIKWQGKR